MCTRIETALLLTRPVPGDTNLYGSGYRHSPWAKPVELRVKIERVWIAVLSDHPHSQEGGGGGRGGALPVFGRQGSSTFVFVDFAECWHNKALRERTWCVLLAAQTRRDSS